MQTQTIFPKVLLISSFIFIFILFYASGSITDDRQQIEKLIESGRLADAQTQINKLKMEYRENADVANALYWIGRKYEWSEKYDEAKTIYSQIIQDYPKSAYERKARLSLAREKVLSMIISGQYENANATIEKLIKDFVGDHDLPDTIYWIGKRYEWSDRYDEAKNVYQQIINNNPSGQYAHKAKFEIEKNDILLLIISKEYDLAEKAIGVFKADFNGYSDLPSALYWIGQRYEWENEYEKEKSMYELIVQTYPKNTYAEKAKLGIARTNVLTLISLEKYSEAERVFGELVSDYSGHSDLSEAMYWIAKSFWWAGEYRTVADIYRKIMTDFSNTSVAAKVRKETPKTLREQEIYLLIEKGDLQEALNAIEVFTTDFNSEHLLPYNVYMFGKKFFRTGEQKEKESLDTKEFFADAIIVWNKVIEEFSDSTSKMYPNTKAYTYFMLGETYYKLNEPTMSRQFFEKFYEAPTDENHAVYSSHMIARCLEKEVGLGLVNEDTSMPEIRKIHEDILLNYPDSPGVEYARDWLEKNPR